MLDTFTRANVGRFYHAIMYGRNVMGSYADKLSYKERWEVIHYIRSLEAQSKKLEYSATSNTFNNEATPWAAMESAMKKDVAPMTADTAMHEAAGSEVHMNQH